MTAQPLVHPAYEPATGTWQYIVADPISKEAAIIDSVLDYDKGTGTISTSSAGKLHNLISQNGYTITYILETHAHADHLTASRYLQNILAGTQNANRPMVGIGARITQVQLAMNNLYHIPQSELNNAFDHLFQDEETFNIGELQARVIHLPGHTPDHIGYVIGSNVFTGDSIFNPDVGSARCDFPGGSATQLYASTQKLLSYPEHFRLYTGHDYPPEGRDAPVDAESGKRAVPFTTVRNQREQNKHLKIGTLEEEFINWRTERDAGLSEPKLLRISMEVNVRGGRLPTTRRVGEFEINDVAAGVVFDGELI